MEEADGSARQLGVPGSRLLDRIVFARRTGAFGMGARPFTEQEFQSIVATLGRLGRHRDKLMIQLGCAVGYRISELLSLRVDQVWSGNASRSFT